MQTATVPIKALRLQCPSCRHEFGDMPESLTSSIQCAQCKFTMHKENDYWDACTDKSYPRDFARQWLLWERGKLGDPARVYGHRPEHYFRECLTHTSLLPEQLASMRVLEVGFGHGRLLQQIQRWSTSAYGIDLATPLRSAQLRPGSAIFGNLLNIPFKPGQFDLVICRGVVHHTPNPKESFGCVAEQVAPGGMLYFSGCYEPGKKSMLNLRNVLRRSWSYPEPMLLGLASTLSGLRAILEGVRRKKMDIKSLRRYSHELYKLDIFDVMAPRWSGVLGADTVVPWFTSRGFKVCKVGDGSYVGINAKSTHEAQSIVA
jgi:2-polyprenyl-3-methyl-5-hydroxy-6-metoxy-1,4-benzoquinol methylase